MKKKRFINLISNTNYRFINSLINCKYKKTTILQVALKFYKK